MVISTGYNGLSKGALDPYDYENKLSKFKGDIIAKGYAQYAANDVYQKIKNRKSRPDKYLHIIHGETNAILAAAKLGISTDKSTLYTQAIPCNECAKNIIQSGVSKVIVHKSFSDIFYQAEQWKPILRITFDMFEESEVEVYFIDVILNETAFISGKEYKL
jgi:dCMP deaminase